MVVYCPPNRESELSLSPCMYTTYTKHTIGRYSTFTSRRPRRRYIPQCTHYSFLVKLLQQKEPQYRVHIPVMKQFMTGMCNVYARYTSALYYI